jgi:hypothetical protein
VCKNVTGICPKLNEKQVNIEHAINFLSRAHEMLPRNKYSDDRFAQEFGIRVSRELVCPSPCAASTHDEIPQIINGEKLCANSVVKWNKN